MILCSTVPSHGYLENARDDAGDLKRILGDSLNLLFHGHTHLGKMDWIH